VPTGAYEAGEMSVLELLRAYTLREYAVVLSMAVLGGLGLVFMLSSMGGGAPAGETLLKREASVRKDAASVRFVEASGAARARIQAAAARRARIRAERRAIAVRAARRARVTAARRAAAAPARTVRRTAPRPAPPTPTRVVSTPPSGPAPAPAPAPKPAPQKSGSSGGGGGSFDDSG
jgi:hypothetical protein